MRRLVIGALCSLALAAAGGASAQPASVGNAAPAFAAKDIAGKSVTLAEFRGKYVILEWTNPDCPYVRKHYSSGNMPATQKLAMAKGAVWLSVSTGDTHSATELQLWQKSKSATPTATLVDPDGRIARAYGARTTPHMYIVDPQGTLIYAGAIDSKPSSNPADIQSATNYVDQALAEVMAGKPVSRAVTQAYGCSVKYPSGA
ncbi:MAG TPA: redoxin domain-containing protein [Burkholderiaceae bacterium]|nr:redoxin domain-containing protein [Burkholderiaceae bacterium]